MATGRLGTADLAATTITDVYTVPASTKASCNVNFANRNASTVAIRLALSDTSATQGNDEFLFYDLNLGPVGSSNSTASYTALMMDAGKIITAYSDASNVSVVVTGVEEAV